MEKIEQIPKVDVSKNYNDTTYVLLILFQNVCYKPVQASQFDRMPHISQSSGFVMEESAASVKDLQLPVKPM